MIGVGFLVEKEVINKGRLKAKMNPVIFVWDQKYY